MVQKTKGSGKTIATIIFLLFIAFTILALSENFENLISPFAPQVKPQATRVQPTITDSFQDTFRDGTIGATRWTPFATDGVLVRETTNENLRVAVDAGSAAGNARRGGLRANPVIGENKDFEIRAQVRRPLVTGTGTGRLGVRFVSSGNLDDEIASLRWVVGGPASYLIFSVKAPDGSVLDSSAVNINTNVVSLRLVRVNSKRYRGEYKLGTMGLGGQWNIVGNERDAALGAAGLVSLFAANNAPEFPQVLGRFEAVYVGWE